MGTKSQRRCALQAADDVGAPEAGGPPRDRAALSAWIERWLGVRFAERALLEGHASPMDYLAWAFFEPEDGPRDAVVWAARGSGKTFAAAVATLLDLVFKPGVEVMILGGSLEQSGRMHAHLRRLFERPGLSALVRGRVTAREVRLRSGSVARLLAQSQTSVRGARPQKLRCDEVDLFDPEVWEAAQLVTRTGDCGWGDGRRPARGAVEALSTCHVRGGLMERLVAPPPGEGGPARRLFRWTIVDALERCPERRACAGCGLWDECAGRARAGAGHVGIDDALALKARVDLTTWRSEMLCERPRRVPAGSEAVYSEFDRAVHVRPGGPEPGDGAPAGRWVCGMDFGFRNPTVILWAVLEAGGGAGEGGGRDGGGGGGGVLRVVDECIERGVTVERHARTIAGGRAGRWPRPVLVAVDPAGEGSNMQTGESDVTVLRREGLTVSTPRLGVMPGVALVRRRMRSADGAVRLLIDPRCEGLIDSLERYRYAGPQDRLPAKDGHDHACDALRYLIAAVDGQVSRCTVRRYGG
ncbi:MAG: DEAD/DEAH box helicase family protein [Phycisphaerales bacterium]|nr:DEAD/DEAH box helicase family protein [Phycisphaerales bacterium]